MKSKLNLSFFFLFFVFGLISVNSLKAQTNLTVIPYGLGKIIVDANSVVLHQHESYLSVAGQHFVKPQYSGDIDSDKHLFEVAVSAWIKQYPAEFKAFKDQQAIETPAESK